MTASGWLRLAGGSGLVGIGALILAALAPLLVRPPQAAEADLRSSTLLACLFLPTGADWAAHLMSYLVLGLLGIGAGRGVLGLIGQLGRTQHMLDQLAAFHCLPDSALAALLARCGLAGRVEVVGVATPFAFCHGLLRPRICLSTGLVALLSAEELTALLWHEEYHRLRRDPLKVALGRAWCAACYFLPLAAPLYQHYLLAKELEADAYACHRQGSAGPLADALCTLLDQAPLFPAAGALAGAGEALEARVAGLLGSPPRLTVPRGPLHKSGLLLASMGLVAWGLAQLAASNALWYVQHSGLGGC